MLATRERVKKLEQEVEGLRADMRKLLRKAFDSREEDQVELLALRAKVARFSEEQRAFTRFLSEKITQMSAIAQSLQRHARPDFPPQDLDGFADAVTRIRPE